MKLYFYEIDKNYISFLKEHDNKVPDIEYKLNDKFLCGTVLEINNIKYYAPISSFIKQQRTNILIKDKNDKTISSIRFSFMIPAFDDVLQIKDFSKESYTYKRLLMEEYKFCNKNREQIQNKAYQVYKIGLNRKNFLAKTCCNFKWLEEKMQEYFMKNHQKQIVIEDDETNIG